MDDATAALADAWASIDGKEGDPEGGYLEDAAEMIRRLENRGYRIVPSADPATGAEADPCPPDDRIERMLAELDNSGEDWRRIAADSLEGVAATLRRGYDKAACETLERCLRQIRGYQTAKTLRERLGAIAEGESK